MWSGHKVCALRKSVLWFCFCLPSFCRSVAFLRVYFFFSLSWSATDHILQTQLKLRFWTTPVTVLLSADLIFVRHIFHWYPQGQFNLVTPVSCATGPAFQEGPTVTLLVFIKIMFYHQNYYCYFIIFIGINITNSVLLFLPLA